MIQKPWPVMIIGVFYIFSPLLNLFISITLSGLPVWEYLATFKTPLDIIEFFFIFPIAGLSLLAFRGWSYFIFLGAFIWSIFYNYKSHMFFPENFPLSYLVLIYLINFLLVSYFFLPTVRAPYFNKRLRWWESLPRFHKVFPAKIKLEEDEYTAEIKNIALGGVLVFIKDKLDFANGSKVLLEFSYEGLSFQLNCEVVHMELSDSNHIGLKFLTNLWGERKKIKKLIYALQIVETPFTRPKQVTIKSLFLWLSQLITTGKGVVPELLPEIDDHKEKRK